MIGRFKLAILVIDVIIKDENSTQDAIELRKRPFFNNLHIPRFK